LSEITTEKYRVEVSDDAMEATLYIEVRGREHLLELSGLVHELMSVHELCGVLEPAVEEAIALAANAEESGALPGVCVARGVAPITGDDGTLEWLGEFFETRALNLPDGSVDHYHHTRCSVYEGQPLAQLHPPTNGTEGLDVFGHEIASSPGKPFALRLDAGAERHSSDENLLVASRGGQVEFDQGRLGVSELRIVKEVDYSVASIDFDGSVEVQGDVGARFEVRGGASVLIHGSVENAEVDSDRQVEIRGPVLGHGEALLVSGSDMLLLSARETEIHCGGQLVVQRELLWCQLEVYGDLCIEHGRLVGGETRLGGKLVVDELGSREEAQTRIELGDMGHNARALRRLKRARKRAYESLAEFHRHHGANLARSNGGPYEPSERESLLKRQSALRAVARRARRRELVLRRRLLRQRQDSCLMVSGRVHAGVEVRYPQQKLVHTVGEELVGPLRIGLDEDSQQIVITKL